MRRLIFEPEHDAFRDSARRFFLNEVGPHGERWRAAGHVDRGPTRKAGEQGYLLMWADEHYGGAGVDDFRYEQILIEENIRHGEPGFYINLHSGLVAPYLDARQRGAEAALPAELRQWRSRSWRIAMTEPDAGSDLAGMKATRGRSRATTGC